MGTWLDRMLNRLRPGLGAAAHAIGVTNGYATSSCRDDRLVDVRDMLSAGEDPLGAILAVGRDVAVGECLVVVAPFDPVPLRRLLGQLCFEPVHTEHRPGCWRITFRRLLPTDGADVASIVQGEDGLIVDTRGLMPPRPMTLLLNLLETCKSITRIDALLDREPVHLLPEIEPHGWNYDMETRDDGAVVLRLTRRPPA